MNRFCGKMITPLKISRNSHHHVCHHEKIEGCFLSCNFQDKRLHRRNFCTSALAEKYIVWKPFFAICNIQGREHTMMSNKNLAARHLPVVRDVNLVGCRANRVDQGLRWKFLVKTIKQLSTIGPYHAEWPSTQPRKAMLASNNAQNWADIT